MGNPENQKSDARFASPERMRCPHLFFRLQKTHSPVSAAMEAEGYAGRGKGDERPNPGTKKGQDKIAAAARKKSS